MILLDANYILRFLLQDNEKMFEEASEVIAKETCLLLNEVMAEVVYVLNGVYKTPRAVIAETLSRFVLLQNMTMYESKSLFLQALKMYGNTKLDFVDCCICTLGNKYSVKSFDKKLMKCIKEQAK